MLVQEEELLLVQEEAEFLLVLPPFLVVLLLLLVDLLPDKLNEIDALLVVLFDDLGVVVLFEDSQYGISVCTFTQKVDLCSTIVYLAGMSSHIRHAMSTGYSHKQSTFFILAFFLIFVYRT